MKLKWNLTTKGMHPHGQLQNKLEEKVAKLETYLEHFPTDAVHLQVSLEQHLKKPLFTAALTLRLPSTILQSEKTGSDPIPALDKAIKALLREITDLKPSLRRESDWSRAAERKA